MKKQLMKSLALLMAVAMVGTGSATIALAADADANASGAATEGAAAEGAATEDAAASGEANEDAAAEDAVNEGESSDGEWEDAESADAESAEGESAEGESAEGESAEGESGDSEAVEVILAETVPAGEGLVTELSANGHSVLVYYPADNIADELAVNLTCTAPLLVVFGDGAFDADSAAEYAESTGLAQIAASEGSSVVFLNPAGDAWTDEDEGTFEALVDLVDDSSTDEHADGISKALNFFTGGIEQKITATKQRMYLYGEGSGAQFIADHLLGSLISATTFPDGTTIEFDNTITGATLNGLESIGEIEPNDIPVVAIDCSDEVVDILTENCGDILVDDTANYLEEYDEMIGNYRRQAGVLISIPDYEEEGITQIIETYTVKTSPDNVTYAGTDTHDVNVVLYIPDDLDLEGDPVPLVVCLHGGGNTALYEAMATEWPEIGKEFGFITVSVDLHHPDVSATEIVELIGQLEEEYPIDPGKIYASGFSMGGCKSWDLYEQYPEVFAGLAPMDASNEVGVDSFGNPVEDINEDTIVPVFYVGGEVSPLEELPWQAKKLVDRVAYLFDVNQVVKPYDVSFDDQESWENPVWGVDGDVTYTADDDIFTDSILTVEAFESEDGTVYTCLALSGNQSHEVYARNSWEAWSFLSLFSRAEDGSIVVDEPFASPVEDDEAVE